MKKIWIVVGIVILLIIAVVLYLHYSPVWVSTATIVAALAGAVAGWFARVGYDKYLKR